MNAEPRSLRDAVRRIHVLSAPIEVVHREPTQLLGYRSLAISKEARCTMRARPRNFPFVPTLPVLFFSFSWKTLSPIRGNKSRMQNADRSWAVPVRTIARKWNANRVKFNVKFTEWSYAKESLETHASMAILLAFDSDR